MFRANKRLVMLFFCATSLLMAAGCASRIDLLVASQPNVNPDHTGRPSPVIMRIYELRSDLAFQQADFYSLFEKYMQVLAADILSAKELTCTPGMPYEVSYEPLPETRYLGVIAGFRQLERAQWRLIVPIDAKGKNKVYMELNDTTLFLVPEDQMKDWEPEEAIERFKQQFENKKLR